MNRSVPIIAWRGLILFFLILFTVETQRAVTRTERVNAVARYKFEIIKVFTRTTFGDETLTFVSTFFEG